VLDDRGRSGGSLDAVATVAGGGVAAAARRVGHRFATRGRGPVLVEVDLDLPRGTLTALAGANGAGKTTLLRILAGLLAPAEGSVVVLGVEQPAAAGGRRARALRARLAYVPQEPALDPEMSGRETLELLAALHGLARATRARRIAELAATFGIASHLPRPIAAWSGGLKRRLHVAAGMLGEPELLLLDEPTAGLDVEGSDAVWAELARRARVGAAVAVVTHELAAAERLADQVVILDAGRVAAAGSPAALLAAHGGADLVEVYRRVTGGDAAELVPRRERGA
jgi:ABC-2 type transport system ATP-binding protein